MRDDAIFAFTLENCCRMTLNSEEEICENAVHAHVCTLCTMHNCTQQVMDKIFWTDGKDHELDDNVDLKKFARCTLDGWTGEVLD